MAKTKSKSKTTTSINPPIKNFTSGKWFEELEQGECFIYNNMLWMKGSGDYTAISLMDGTVSDDEFEADSVSVIPVNITIYWTAKGK